MTITYRMMTETDLNDDFLTVLSVFGKPVVTRAEAYRQWFRRGVNQKGFVAVDGEKIVGFAALLIEPKFWQCGSVGHIEDVAVLPEYRQQGVASDLLKCCENYAKQFGGCYKLVLYCDSELCDFYTRNGYYKAAHLMRRDL